MKVKATQQGFYANRLIEPGEVFEIGSEEELGRWMEPVKAEKAEKQPAPPKDAGKAEKAEK